MLLRLRSFTVAKHIPDHEVTGAGFAALLTTLFRKMEPLVRLCDKKESEGRRGVADDVTLTGGVSERRRDA